MVVVLKSVRKICVGSRGFSHCYSLLSLEVTLCMLEKSIVDFHHHKKNYVHQQSSQVICMMIEGIPYLWMCEPKLETKKEGHNWLLVILRKLVGIWEREVTCFTYLSMKNGSLSSCIHAQGFLRVLLHQEVRGPKAFNNQGISANW